MGPVAHQPFQVDENCAIEFFQVIFNLIGGCLAVYLARAVYKPTPTITSIAHFLGYKILVKRYLKDKDNFISYFFFNLM